MSDQRARALDRAVSVLTCLTSLTGIAALGLVDGISTVYLAFFAGLLLIFVNMRLVVGWTLPVGAARLLNLILILLLVATAAVVLPRGMSRPGAGLGIAEVGHVLVLLIVLRTAQRRRPRDDWFLLLGAGTALGLVSFTVSTVTFLPVVLGGSALATCCAFLLLLSGEIRSSTPRRVTHDLAGRALRRGSLRRGAEALFLGGRMMLVFIVLVLVAFLGIPRSTEVEEEEEADPTFFGDRAGMRGGGGPADPVKPRRGTGFRETVDLGDVAAIKKNMKIAFWVRVYRDRRDHVLTPEEAYFRGEILTRFDGRRWRTHAPVRKIAVADAARRAEWVELLTLPERFEPYVDRGARVFHYVEQEILINDMPDDSVLFALDRPWLLDLGAEPRFAVGPAGTLRLTRKHRPHWGYTVVSLRPRHGQGNPWRESISPGLRVLYTHVPEGLERLSALAVEVAGSRPPGEVVPRLVAELGRRCRYTLEVPKLDPKNPIDGFVFETKEGHCELFASALAMMLRSVGIPSRLVVGFRGHEMVSTETQELHQIRYSNAHAWVEAFLPGRGWVTLDPTPGDEQAEPARAPGMAEADAEIPEPEEPATPWDEWILTYDRQAQRDLVEGAGEWVGSVGEEIDLRVVTFVSLGLGLLGTAFLLPGLLRHRRTLRATRRSGPKPSGPGGASVRRAYLSMLGLLAHRGIRRAASETPREVARRAARALPEAAKPVQALTRLHQDVVYGDREAGREDGRRAAGMLSETKAALTKRSG